MRSGGFEVSNHSLGEDGGVVLLYMRYIDNHLLGKGMRSLLLPFLLIGMVVPSAAQLWTSACRVFPTDNIWNTPINKVPVHPRSSAYVNTIGADLSLRNDFGSGLWNGAPIGISYNIVGSSTPRSSVVFDYTDESDIVGYPIPQAPLIEGGDSGTGDRHVLMLDTSECKLYELYHVYNRNNVWTAGSGAVFDLTSNTLRPDTWTSADAAGLPILPGLVRYEEVAGGEIGHMIRFTVPKTSRAYLWPARHYASSITDPAYPPMGLVMRLKSTFDTSKPQAAGSGYCSRVDDVRHDPGRQRISMVHVRRARRTVGHGRSVYATSDQRTRF